MEAAGSSERTSRVGASPAERRPWAGRHIVLGVAGGIAAYKSVQLARDLTRLGAIVDVVMTTAAREFVGPISFEAVTGRPVARRLIEEGDALVHIRLARAADVVCVAPATADLLARAAAGRADDLLSAILLATRAPVLLCPAMNDAMWAHPATQRNVEWLRDVAGHRIAGPAVGPLAYGEGEGPGRMEEPEVLLEHVGRTLEGRTPFTGRRVVVTAGPTREPVDPVRVLSNRSSGRMGYALALAAWRRGAEVTLIAGPAGEPPSMLDTIRIETAAGMEAALREALPAADVLVMAAAVADFRPAAVASGKIRRAEGPASISLEPVSDLLAATRPLRKPGAVIAGFALETEPGEAAARAKLEAKGLDLIVLNRADEPGAGFETETNRVTLIGAAGETESLPLLSKDEVAEHVLDRIAGRLGE